MTVFYSKSWNICSAKFGWNLCLFKSTYMNCIDPEGKKKILSKLTDIPVYNWVDVHMVSKIVSNKTICYNKACSIAWLRLDRSIEHVPRSHDWSCPCFTRLKTRAFVISSHLLPREIHYAWIASSIATRCILQWSSVWGKEAKRETTERHAHNMKIK